VARRLTRGEIRLLKMPAPDKTRPVLVLTSDVALAVLSRVTVAPVSSTIRGVPSEIPLDERDGMKRPCAVNLHNLVTVEQAALGALVAVLSPARMEEVCGALAFALGCVQGQSHAAGR
jgi:mRNA interferase MazF